MSSPSADLTSPHLLNSEGDNLVTLVPVGAIAPSLPGLSSQPTGQNTGQQIAFVDSALDNVDDLIASLTDATVYLIDGQEGVSYITDVLTQHQSQHQTNPIGGVHIFAHGHAGALQLGTTTLTADSLNGHADNLAVWGNSQTNDILLYGCDVAKGATGNAFIDQLAALTGADVQASNDITGSAVLGGDWDLEITVGTIETGLAISAAGQASYQGTLASPVITSNEGGDSAAIFINEGTSFVTDVNVTGANGYSEGNGVEYYFNAGDDAYLFDIDVDTGVISFKNAPDYERPEDVDGNNVYFANVLAIDWSGQADSQFLAIVVQDVAESGNAPVITSNGGGDYVYKQVEEGTAYVLDMAVSDVDGQSEGNGITYRINAGADADLFNIDVATGALSFKSRPDYEAPTDADGDNIYQVNVLATDSTGLSDSQFIEIEVGDTSGDEPLVASVVENTTEVSSLPVTDAYGGSISYTLSGDDADLFEVSATGELTFKAAPDFENPADVDGNNLYRFTLTGLNSVNIATPREVSVTVTNQVSVYLLGGQSNMAGETSNASDLAGTAYANPLPAVQIWQPGFNAFEALRPGFNGNFGTGLGFGAELGFGHMMEAARASGTLDSEEIYIVKYAIGATSLDIDWNVNGTNNQYDNFTAWVGGALANLAAANLAYQVEGMLWMQGENDANDAGRAANYQSNLTNLITDVRDRYGADMDFVIGRLHEELEPGFYGYAEEVRNAQETVANTVANTDWVDTDSFMVNPIDGVHFNSFGHLALGEAFAKVFTS